MNTFFLLSPASLHHSFYYVVVILICLWFPTRRQIIFAMMVCILYVSVGYYFSPDLGATNWIVIFNRGLALLAIISTVTVIFISKSSIESQQENNNEALGQSFSLPDSDNAHFDLMHKTGFLGILIGVPILLAVIGSIFWNTSKVDDDQQWVSHTHEVQTAISRVLSTLQDAETGQRGYLLTNDISYLEPFTSAIGRLDSELSILQQLTIDNSIQQARLERAYPLVESKLEELRNTIELMNTQGQKSALNLVKTNSGKETMDALRAILKEMRDEEGKLLIERADILERDKKIALFGQIMGLTFLLLVGMYVTFRGRGLLRLQAEAESKLKYMANHDVLTGLATRRLGTEQLSFACARARRNNCKAAILFIDLDGFKAVNDTHGHDVGDSLLVGVAERLLCCVREVDTVARIGGDEFMIVLSDISSHEKIAQIAQKVIDALSELFLIGNENVSIGASIGIALYPDHAQDPEALVKCADDAMYAVKSKGKNNFSFAENS